MFHKQKIFICFTLIFTLTLIQVHVLGFNESYAQNNELSTTEEVKVNDTDDQNDSDSDAYYYDLLNQSNIISYTLSSLELYKSIASAKNSFEKYIKEYADEVIVQKEVISEKVQSDDFISMKNFTSKTNHYIWVDTEKNLVHIFEKNNEAWSLIRSMPCTDGKASTPTVKGNFTIGGRAPWLISYSGTVKAKYKVRFFGHYYFHSILFDSKGKNIVDSRLGESLSHGCIRLSVDNAKWIYDNIGDGTGVYIE